MKKILFLICVLALLHNNTNAQKNDLTNIAIASGVSIGLAAILSDNGDNAQDFLESRMLDHILINETLTLPQKLKVSLINKPNNKQEYIKANCYIFNVRGNKFGNFIYLMVLGNKRFDYGNGFDFRKLTYLKYDKTRWEQYGMEIIKSLSPKKDKIIDNLIITENVDHKNDTVNLYNLTKIEDDYFVFSKNKDSYYLVESKLDRKKIAEDNHILFSLPPDLSHPEQRFIFDYSELRMNIFIPHLQESVFISNKEFIQITDSLIE